MGSSVLLVLIGPIMLVDFIDKTFGTDLTTTIPNVLFDVFEKLSDAGIIDKVSYFILDIVEILKEIGLM